MEDPARKLLETLAPADVVATVNDLIGSAASEQLEFLQALMCVRADLDALSAASLPRFVAQSFLALGDDGVHLLESLLSRTTIYRSKYAIVLTLYYASGRENPHLLFYHDLPGVIYRDVSETMAAMARRVLEEAILNSRTDDEYRGLITTLIQQEDMLGHGGRLMSLIYETFTESSLEISAKLIDELERLIDAQLPEERYQVFLENHPVFLDPLAWDVIPKQKLGSEYVTDFVVRKLDDEYLVVEIEKPNTRIFTKSDDFSAEFSHAIGQVMDFQEWIESNIGYAEKHMPGIRSPMGIVVIGIRCQLSERQRNKLQRFNLSCTGRIRAVCFDDLLESGRKLHRNIRRPAQRGP